MTIRASKEDFIVRRKLNKKGLPGYLSHVLNSWKELKHWDKILIVSLMRYHKCTVFPIRPDTRTITDPLTSDQELALEQVRKDMRRHWRSMGMRSVEDVIKRRPNFTIKSSGYYLYPKQLGSQ